MDSIKIALLFASITVVILSTIAFVRTFSFESEVITVNFYSTLFPALVLGIMGFLIGKVLNNARIKK